MPRVDASDDVLDAAERLFAEHGIATVSDRKIADAAGNTNHSAVRYYFGGRPGLLSALVERHHAQVQPVRRAMQAESTSLADDVRAMVLPQVYTFRDLGAPSWRARFLANAYVDPQGREVIRRLGHDPVTGGTVFDAVRTRLADLDQRIVTRRAEMMGYMVVSACARLEEREAHSEQVSWEVAGWFLCDAIAGMLQAPVSAPPAGWPVD
ncbi:TetR/AcrR family transcriptional regulator [Nocardioides jishulii]|uniref:TetR/AcrR family transcriptional regulator n=1 Tax=Nocardioides jishulii TaxID=2575440 RepID=A0A4U2YLU6_9ACTN|nr:TetR/AcrR family transcriptional regulator [Nocardioides jishulii]QCX27020.1 TetR/AcrR family transcriptional regulator [Nocardioides jishulii]TKI61502.1 TetR/AcrR family transcriptional regulator [Nocardioides jishulii]